MDNANEMLDTLQEDYKNALQNNTTEVNNNIYNIKEADSNPNGMMAKPTQVIGENNHAESLANNAMSAAEAKQTFNYTPEKDKSLDTSVKTQTVQSNGATMDAVWDSQLGMDDDIKVKDGDDYSWNKMATSMANLKYKQEESQARYESMQAKQELDEAASKAWNEYFGAEYSARQTQDKMGWTGGQQTASDLQVAFLQAETASNMYTKDELQKYGVDTKLSIARMYAEADQKTLALQYYQDAVDQSIKEAEQTGWYIPAEAKEMLGQDQAARDVLNDPTATAEDKQRAEKVLKATQKYYDAKGFQHGYAYDDKGNVVTEYYGIKTLQTLQHEETVRNNKINEELQRQANDIAAEGVQASKALGWANLKLSYAIQEQNRTNILTQNVTTGYAAKVTSKSNTNYYIGSDGKAHNIDPGSTMIRQDGQYYYGEKDKTGGITYKPVYNYDESYATAHKNNSAYAEGYSNYRPIQEEADFKIKGESERTKYGS